MLNPFGANINDILVQSFFLKAGFVGDFVRKKVLRLLDWLDGNEDKNLEWDIDKAEKIVNSFGEPIIKNHLQNMLEYKKRRIYAKNIDR